jgi:hypothetical protein
MSEQTTTKANNKLKMLQELDCKLISIKQRIKMIKINMLETKSKYNERLPGFDTI